MSEKEKAIECIKALSRIEGATMSMGGLTNRMEEAHLIFDQATTMGLIHLPIIGFTYPEFVQGRYATTFTESVLIDNVDMLVQYISKVPVEAK